MNYHYSVTLQSNGRNYIYDVLAPDSRAAEDKVRTLPRAVSEIGAEPIGTARVLSTVQIGDRTIEL